MAKYDWIALEKEYVLSDYKSVSAFLKDKEINNNGTTRKHTSGWKEKKRQKEDKKATKTVAKVIEKESEKEAQKIVDIKSLANDLALNVLKANKELNLYVDIDGNIRKGTIDRKGLKQLTSALKDLSDIIPQKEDDEEDNSFIEALNGKVEDIWNEEK